MKTVNVVNAVNIVNVAKAVVGKSRTRMAPGFSAFTIFTKFRVTERNARRHR